MKIIKNEHGAPIDKIYPYRIIGSWDQYIDCDLVDLKKFQKEIKKILDNLDKV